MHRTVAAAVVAALALGVASCGGAEPLTRAELARRIELACRQGQVKAQQQQRAASSRDARTSGMALIDSVLANQRYVVERVDDLKPSDAQKSDFEAFKQGVQQRVALLVRVQRAGSANLQAAISSVQQESGQITATLQRAAKGLGVQGCA